MKKIIITLLLLVAICPPGWCGISCDDKAYDENIKKLELNTETLLQARQNLNNLLKKNSSMSEVINASSLLSLASINYFFNMHVAETCRIEKIEKDIKTLEENFLYQSKIINQAHPELRDPLD